MKQRRLGRSGRSVSEICLATLPTDALAECDRLSREIRYPLG